MPLEPRITSEGPSSWHNRHGTVSQRVAKLWNLRNAVTPHNASLLEAYNATTKGIQGVLSQANESRVQVKPLGAGWSFSEVLKSKGWLLNTQPLDFSFRLTGSAIHEEYSGDRNGLRFVQCGMGIAQLGSMLRRDSYALRTSGASNGQTIAGALSTGTHGAGIDVGSVQDFVIGLHIVIGPDTTVFLQRSSSRVVTKEFAEDLGTQLIEDDQLFNAALVSFGSFGVILGVVLETDPLYLLECYRKRIPLSALMPAIERLSFDMAELPHPGERPYHFQVVINPHDLASGTYVTIMYKRGFREDYTPPPLSQGSGPGDDAPAFIGLLTDLLPDSIPGLVNTIVAGNYKEYQDQYGTLAEIFTNTDTRGKVDSTAMGVPLERVREALDALLFEHRRSGPFAGVFALRYVKGTEATLGFTRYPVTCVVELDGVTSNTTEEFYSNAWKRLRTERIPFTFHWGKQNDLTATRVRAMYEERADSWIKARRAVLTVAQRAMFSNRFLKKLNMDT